MKVQANVIILGHADAARAVHNMISNDGWWHSSVDLTNSWRLRGFARSLVVGDQEIKMWKK